VIQQLENVNHHVMMDIILILEHVYHAPTNSIVQIVQQQQMNACNVKMDIIRLQQHVQVAQQKITVYRVRQHQTDANNAKKDSIQIHQDAVHAHQRIVTSVIPSLVIVLRVLTDSTWTQLPVSRVLNTNIARVVLPADASPRALRDTIWTEPSASLVQIRRIARPVPVRRTSAKRVILDSIPMAMDV